MIELFEADEVRKALGVMLESGAVFEVRAVEAQLLGYGNRRPGTVSGYFDSIDACLSELKKLASAKGIYITLNPVNPACLARRANRLAYADKDSTTKDHHILRRRYLPIDVDYDRPSGISTTNAEKEITRKKAREIYAYLKDRGWPPPVVADSGNAYHLDYRIELPCEDDGLVEKALDALANRFDGDRVLLDRGVHNESRIIKLYGTLVCKGDNMPERPWRLSKILDAPVTLEVVTTEQVRALVDELLPKEPEKSKASESRSAEHSSKPSKEQVREMLAVIPKRPHYHDWIKLCAAVGDALNESDAVQLLNEWSPEEEPGEYAQKLQSGFDKIHVGTLFHIAKQHGWKPAHRAQAEREPVEPPPAPAPYVPPPLDLFPDKVQRFIRTGAATFDVDPAFFLLPVLSGGAAMIGNARSIRLKEDYIEPSIIWTATIAPTGDGKSPGLQAATAPVRMRERELKRKNKEADKNFAEDSVKWDAKSKKDRVGEEKPSPPPLLTCWMDDTTIEAVARRLNDNPHGVALVKDEFSHWFESMDQYHDRGGSDVSRWLTIWTGNLFALDRVSGGRSYRIADPRLSITGGVVPDKFKHLLTEDFFVRGLPARFLFAMPTRNHPRKWVDKDISKEVKKAVNELFASLAKLPPHKDEETDEELPVLLGLTPEAKEIFVEFYNECARRAFDADVREAAQWSKLSAYSARLALVGQLMHDPGATEISVEVMRAACDLARWFGNEAERIYALIAETPEQRQRRKLVRFIECRGGRVTVREVTQLFRPLKNNRDEAERHLNALVRAGYGEWTETKGARGPAASEFHLLQGSTSTGFEDSPSVEPQPVDVDSESIQENEISADSDTEDDKSQLLHVSTSTGLLNSPSITSKPVDVDTPSVQKNVVPLDTDVGSPHPTPKKLRL